MVRLVHHLPGRLRLQLGMLRGDRSRSLAALRLLDELPGIVRAEASVVTGSLTIRYDERQLRPGQIIGALANAGFSRSLIEIRRAHAPARRPLPPWVKPAAKLAAIAVANVVLPMLVERTLGRTPARILKLFL